MKNLVLIIIFCLLSACVPSRTVSERQIGDNKLTCIEIADHVGELNGLKALYQKQSSGYFDTRQSYMGPSTSSNNINSVDKRKAVLADYYNDRGCNNDVPEYTIEEIKQKIEANELKELQG